MFQAIQKKYVDLLIFIIISFLECLLSFNLSLLMKW